jgi:hypothetical protein
VDHPQSGVIAGEVSVTDNQISSIQATQDGAAVIYFTTQYRGVENNFIDSIKITYSIYAFPISMQISPIYFPLLK